MAYRPETRALDIFPVDIDGQRLICIRDPQKICEQTMMINDVAFHFFTMMDGRLTVKEICEQFEKRFGKAIPEEQINGFVDQLDEYYFLNNRRFQEKLEEAWREYDALETRPCSHAGASYPENPDELKKFIESFYASADAVESSGQAASGKVKGIVAPHIDVRHGGNCFAAAYAHLKNRRPEVYVIFGVGHGISTNLYTVCPKDFETPLGRVPVDVRGLEKLQELLGEEIFAEDFLHRNEHSVEFQTVFLRSMWGDAEPVPVIPVLCSSFHEIMTRKISPVEIRDVKEFIDAIKEAVGDRDACYIAGVDLAHCGLKFGDRSAPDDAAAEEIMKADLADMALVASGDAEGFWNSIAESENARNVCGVSALYTFLKCVGSDSGRVLKYDQMRDPHSGSLVSYVSMMFE